MKLEDCTKSELIALIQNHLHNTGEDLEREIMLIRCDKANEDMRKAGEAAGDLLQKYIDLMKPYEGKKFSELPTRVLEKARDLLDKRERCLALEKQANARYEKANRRWRELAGF